MNTTSVRTSAGFLCRNSASSRTAWPMNIILFAELSSCWLPATAISSGVGGFLVAIVEALPGCTRAPESRARRSRFGSASNSAISPSSSEPSGRMAPSLAKSMMTLPAAAADMKPPKLSGLPETMLPPWLLGLPRWASGRLSTTMEGKPVVMTAPQPQISPTRAAPRELTWVSGEAETMGEVPCPGTGQTCMSPRRAIGIMPFLSLESVIAEFRR
ncbi:hypothetical protein D9M68_654880 [compost metagenome]